MQRTAILGCAFSLLSACSSSSNEPVVFPADYAATYTEVRNCRGPSVAHQNENIRVVASPDALTPYQGRSDPFPVGAVVLKEQYSSTDMNCSGNVVEYSVMVRLATGSAPTALDWTWQAVSGNREVLSDDVKTCISCHSDCDGEGGGYSSTCEDP
jgi:hypothetical protein